MTDPAKWPEERVQLLRQRVEDGWSAGMIATEFHIGRGAVMGKIRRLGLRLSRPPNNNSGIPKKRTNAKKKTAPITTPPPLHRESRYVAPTYKPNPVTILEIDWSRQCHWVIDGTNDGLALFCGAPREYPGDDGQHMYCNFHAGLAYPSGNRRRANGTVNQPTIVGLRTMGAPLQSGAPILSHLAGVPP